MTSTADSDREIAFDVLYEHHADRLYRFLLRLTGGDRDRTEDVFQDTWLAAFTGLRRFEGRSAFYSWLVGIALNQWRRLLRVRWPESLASLPSEPAIPPPLPERFDVQSVLGRLPDGYRAALVLNAEGFGHGEIAEMLGISVGTSKSQLSRARRAARALARGGGA